MDSANPRTRSTTPSYSSGRTAPVPMASSSSRSPGSSTSTRLSLVVGSATTVRRNRTSRCARRSAVALVNRSVLYSTMPRIPAGRPSAYCSSSSTVRSNFDRSDRTGSTRPVRPGSSSGASSLVCNVSMTWNSGCRLSERTGFSASTRCSNGTSWCW